MPNQARLSIDLLVKKARTAFELGVPAVALFPALPDDVKDTLGTESANSSGLLQRAIRALKLELPALTVITDVAPNDIVTSNRLAISPLSPVGIEASKLTARQRDLLMKVVDVYVGAMADDIASDRMARLKTAGLEKITFAWAGPAERGHSRAPAPDTRAGTLESRRP